MFEKYKFTPYKNTSKWKFIYDKTEVTNIFSMEIKINGTITVSDYAIDIGNKIMFELRFLKFNVDFRYKCLQVIS